MDTQFVEGWEHEDADISKPYQARVNFPTAGQLPQAQVLTTFLLIWANYFDELKLYIDAFKTIRVANYDGYDSVPYQFMPFLARYYGFELPNPFSMAGPKQFHDTRNLTFEKGRSVNTLKENLKLMWNNLLIQFPYIIRSKGTIKSIKSLMNSVGINLETSFRIREYGGSKKLTTKAKRIKRESQNNYLHFPTRSYLSSSLLRAYRHAPGAPDASSGPTAAEVLLEAGDIKIVKPGSAPILTQFTSGSWTYEGMYTLNSGSAYLTQSLFRIESRINLYYLEIGFMSFV